MGGSNAICIDSNFNQENEKPTLLVCSTGVISLDIKTEKTGEAIFDAGIIPSSSKINNFCNNEAFTDASKCSDLVKT